MMKVYSKHTAPFSSQILSAAVIIITLLITVTAAFALPSPKAIAQGIDKIPITPGISPAQENLVTGTPKDKKFYQERAKDDPKFAERATEIVGEKEKKDKDTLKVLNAT